MLVRMWKKGNPFVLLVGMQIGANTVKSTMEFPQKIKKRVLIGVAVCWVLSHKTKSCQFDSWSGHMPGL